MCGSEGETLLGETGTGRKPQRFMCKETGEKRKIERFMRTWAAKGRESSEKERIKTKDM